MREFPPNINPQLFTLSASIVGYSIVPYFDADELNSIGNWLMSVGQYLETVAVQATLINNRYKRQEDRQINFEEQKERDEFEVLQEVVYRLQKEIEQLKTIFQSK